MNAEIVLEARNIVGESLIWDHRCARLFWVDIVGKKIHALDPQTGRHQTWDTPGIATSIGLAAGGGYVLGMARDVVLWRPGSEFEYLATPEPDLPENRLNEGVVGPDGAFWVGTMQNNLNADGSLREMTGRTGAIYRVEADGRVTQVSERTFGITNTLVWDGNRLITADTADNTLYSFAVASDTGTLSDRRTILADFERGLPDGSAQDADGMIWNCRVGGGACLLQIAPDGQQLRTVELPVLWPTSCAFGGPEMNALYVTSARIGLPEEHLKAHPQEGALVKISTDANGWHSNIFAI